MLKNPSKPAAGLLGIHPGALGDLVLFGRLLERLGGPARLVAGWSKGLLLRDLGVVDSALAFDALPFGRLFSGGALDELSAGLGPCERLVSCFGDQPHIRGRLAAACGAASAEFLPIRPPPDYRGHLLELWCDMLGLSIDISAMLAWRCSAEQSALAADALRSIGVEPDQPFLLVHPGAGGPEKCWPVERFARLAELLGSVAPVVIILGPVEAERMSGAELAELRPLPVLENPPVSTLAGVLGRASGFVGNDSGVGHLAAALGCPTVSLFGPTEPRHFAPLGPSVTICRAGAMSDISIDAAHGACRKFWPIT